MRIAVSVAVAAMAIGLTPAPAAATVVVVSGRVAPAGTALLRGALPRLHRLPPRSFVLSRDGALSAADIRLAAVVEPARLGRYRAWISLPSLLPAGPRQLLACRRAVPRRASCWPVGPLRVRLPLPTPTATAQPSGPTVQRVFDSQGGSLAVHTADGTTFTLTVPPTSVFSDVVVSMTPVGPLLPVTATGRLVAGVVIGPAGDAPAGATLTIHPAGGLDARARVVGFGGIDPAGAAFPLPVILAGQARIALEQFGGYGITEPATALAPVRAACPGLPVRAAGSRPLVSCSSAAQRIEELRQALAPQLAQARQDELMGRAPSDALDRSVSDGMDAAERAIEREASAILSQPPSDAGLAELEVVVTLDLGIKRQDELMGTARGPVGGRDILERALTYVEKLVKSRCQTPISAVDRLAAVDMTMNLARTYDRIGLDGQVENTLATAESCFKRTLVSVDASADATTDSGEITLSTSVSSNGALVTGDSPDAVPPVLLWGDDTPLSFGTTTATVDPVWQQLGETATVKSTSGVLHLGSVAWSAQTQIRCDKNRQFVVTHTAHVIVDGKAMWQDAETVHKAIQGQSIGDDVGSAVNAAWENDFPASVSTRIVLPLDGATTVEKQGSGTLANGHPYSYDAKLTATPMVN